MGNNIKAVLFLLLLAAITVAGNVLYQRYDDRMRKLAASSVDWPAVPGLITHSELEARRNKVGTGKKTRYTINIVYEFVVNDKVFHNDVVRFDQGSLSTNRKQLLVSAYPVGKRVEVFYNPDDPDQSVLVRGSHGGVPQ